MTPMHAQERERYGDRAFARVPLIPVGGPLPRGAIQGRFQQSDLAPSLAYLTGTQSCRNAGQGSYLRPDPQPAQYTLHVRGDEHGRIDVAFDGGAGALLLAGDASRSIGTTPLIGRGLPTGFTPIGLRVARAAKQYIGAFLLWMASVHARPAKPRSSTTCVSASAADLPRRQIFSASG